ncbi:HAD hydrolase family protein, partial [Bacteroidota bacterium]
FINIDDKLSCIKDFCLKEGYRPEEIAYIGDDTNDEEIMNYCGVTFSVNDAVRAISKIAQYKCKSNGGSGAFREAVDLILQYRTI